METAIFSNLNRVTFASIGLGLALSVILFTTKSFGIILGLFIITSIFTIRTKHLEALNTFDVIFLCILLTYPTLVIANMFIHRIAELSLFDNPSRFIFIGILYLFLRTIQIRLNYLAVGACIGIAASFLGGADYIFSGGWGRYSGYENALSYAQINFLLLSIAFLLLKENDSENPHLFYVYSFIFLLASFNILISQARGVLIVLAAFYTYIIFFDKSAYLSRKGKLVISLSIFALFFLSISNLTLQKISLTPNELLSNLESPDTSTSMGQRLIQWKKSIELIRIKPLAGHGIDRFNYAFNQLSHDDETTPLILNHPHAHNELINSFVELGIAGPLVLIIIFVLPHYAGIKLGFDETSIYLLGVLGLSWVAFGLTQTQIVHHKVMLLQLFVIVVGFSYGMNNKYGLLAKEPLT